MITKDYLTNLKKTTERSLKYSERVLEGDSEYDGADAAREIKDLCIEMLDLIEELDKHLE